MGSILWNSFVKSVIVAGLVLSIGNIEVRASSLRTRSLNLEKILKIIGLDSDDDFSWNAQTVLTGKYGFCVVLRDDVKESRSTKTGYDQSLDIYGNRRTDVCYLVGDACKFMNGITIHFKYTSPGGR
eukprot:143139_1